MRTSSPLVACAFAFYTAVTALPVRAADFDPLDLQSTPSEPANATPARRFSVEVAAIHANRRLEGDSQDGSRVSLDLRLVSKPANNWRLGFSDRFDSMHPPAAGERSTHNSLREAYVGWQSDDSTTLLEAGRINVRHGPAYGYNPTDYFRTGATRFIVNADPIALRENRVGTFMLRGSKLWDNSGASIVMAPKLTSDGPSNRVLTLDLGATNASNRLLLTANGRASDRWSGEGLVFLEEGQSPRIGANATGLLTDSAVLYAEWSSSRSAGLLAKAVDESKAHKRRYDQVSVGLTYSLPGGLSLTVEAEYNGAGLDRQDERALFAQSPVTLRRFFGSTQASQDLAARRAWLLYANQKGFLTKQLDLNAFVRQNAIDHSTLAWAELRYRWPQFDAALQFQRSSNRAQTEYWALPYRQVIQLQGFYYF